MHRVDCRLVATTQKVCKQPSRLAGVAAECFDGEASYGCQWKISGFARLPAHKCFIRSARRAEADRKQVLYASFGTP